MNDYDPLNYAITVMLGLAIAAGLLSAVAIYLIGRPGTGSGSEVLDSDPDDHLGDHF